MTFSETDGIDTALIDISCAITRNGYLTRDNLSENWLWQMETNGDVCGLTGKRYYYIKNVNTGLYLNGTDRPVEDKRRAWLYSCVADLDSVYGDKRIWRDSTINIVDYNDSVFHYIRTNRLDTAVQTGFNQMWLVHFSDDGDSIRIDERLFPALAYDDGENLALDRLLAYKDSLVRIYWKPEREYVVGDGVGQISQALLDSVQARYDELLETSYLNNLPADAYDAARLRLQAALHSADSAAALVPEGYYRFTGFVALDRRRQYALRSLASELYATQVGTLKADEVFHVTKLAKGGYSVRNVADSLYLGMPEMSSSNTSAIFAGAFYFDHAGSDSLTLYGYDHKGEKRCYRLTGSTKRVNGELMQSVMAYGSRYAWHLEPMNDVHFIDSLREAVAQTWRDDRLAKLLETVTAATDSARVAYQMERPEVEQAVDGLRQAIGTAQLVATGTTRMADIAALRTAYDAFLAVWADSTTLQRLVEQAQRLIATTSETASFGAYPAYAREDLSDKLQEAEALRPYSRLNKAQTDTAVVALQRAIEDFSAQVILPEEDGLYFIVSHASVTDRQRSTYGQCLYAEGYDAHAAVKWGEGKTAHEQDGLAAWRFVALGEGRFALRNAASAWFLGATDEGQIYMSDTVVPYRLVPLSETFVAFQSVGSNCVLTPHWDGRLATGEALAETPSMAAQYPQAWSITDVDPDRMTDVKLFAPQTVHIVALPYTTTQLPQSNEASLQWFTIEGARRDAEGRVTALALNRVTDETLMPGTPYVLVVGSSIEGNQAVPVDMCLDIYNAWPDTTASYRKGAVGTLRDLALQRDGLAVAGHGLTLQAIDATGTTFVYAQQGYVRLGEVPEAEAAAYDAWLPVSRAAFAPRDHNHDGRTNLPDAVIIIERIANGNLNDADLYDHSRDGVVNLPDAEIILQQVADE